MHRENTISEHLRDLLDVYPEVNISGIGLFAIISKSAWIDESSNELYPPTKTLSIRPELSTAIDFMAGIEAIKNDNVDRFIELRKRLNSHVEELRQTKSTRINGIGVIKKLSDQQIDLVDVHQQWGEGTSYLPVLDLYPLSKDSDILESDDPKVESIQTKARDEIQSVSVKELSRQSFLPLIVLCIGVAAFLWFFKGCDLNNSANQALTNKKLNVENVVVDTIANVNSKYEAYLSPDILKEGCKIVVGSYSQRVNAESQLTKFSSLGYMVEMSRNANSYRVLIIFNCNEHNLKDYLDRVKEEVAPSAWYLSPQIKTEDL